MAEEDGLDGDIYTQQARASTRQSPVMATIKIPANSGKQQDSDKRKATEGISTNTVPYYKLFSFADSWDYLLMLVGTVTAVANGLCLPAVAILFGELMDAFGKTANTNNVLHEASKLCMKFVYLSSVAAVASFFQVTCWMVTGERQATRIRSLYLKTILRQDIAFFDKETDTGEVVGRMSGDTVLIQDAMGEKVGTVIQLAATFIGGFFVAFFKGWLLALVLLSCIPPLVASSAVMTILLTKMASREQTAYSVASSVVEQTIGSIRTVISFTGEKQAIAKYNKSLTKAYDSGLREGLATGLGLGSLLFIVFCIFALAVWFGAKLIIDRGYSGGNVVGVIVAVLTGSMSLGQTSPCIKAFAAGQAAAFKMFETINRRPEIDAYDTKGLKLDDISGDIELRNVYFSYPARPDEQIFSGFSLSIPSGTTTALIGQSGSGKSTVINLIERFYDPQAGEVLIDGINLKDFQLRWIRKKIGLVNQEPVLFASSIRDNIAYGKDDATIEEIKAAAELANAAKFIHKLPQGLDTMVGEHGMHLSGGQKQRVAIARAILKNPRILLLDEATSALDLGSERIVKEALDRVMMNRTTVIVAHRLSTVRNADMIAVIHQGKIVEKGSHTELLKDPHGPYHQLVQLQEISNKSEKHDESWELSGAGRHIHFPFANSFGVSPGISLLETAPAKPNSEPFKQPTEGLVWRLACLNKPEIPVLLLGTVAAFANGLILPVFAVLFSAIINTFYEPAYVLQKDSKFWALMFFFLGVASLLISPSRTYLFAVAGCKLIQRIRSMCFERVVHMEIGWFDKAKNSSGAIGGRLSADAASVRSLVGDALALVVQNIATVTAGLAAAFQANWQLALIILFFLPLIGINGFIQLQFTKGFSAVAKKRYEEASQVANEAVGNIRTVASFCAEEKVMQLYQKKCEGPTKTGISRSLISGFGFGLSFFFVYFVYAVTFYAGARLIHDGKTTFSKILRVFFALSMVGLGVSQSGSYAPDASKAKSCAASIFAILDQTSEIDSSCSSGKRLKYVKGDIKFRHVSFRYPTRPEIEIFRDLCLTIRSGKQPENLSPVSQTVALVGESGSGKSTVISLLQRFYDPDSGRITLDGVEIQKLQLRWLRQQIGLVSQEPVLFNDTVRANIGFGKEGNATETEIIAAAELANAHCFISSLQQGYDTAVGERGVQLSGGQKQRVAIARAVVKGPKILLLDEATSALDAESERVVQDALDRVMAGKTTLVVAHRLSTIKGADFIAVFKNGVIAEKGNHETLMNINNGLYASLLALHAPSSSH